MADSEYYKVDLKKNYYVNRAKKFLVVMNHISIIILYQKDIFQIL